MWCVTVVSVVAATLSQFTVQAAYLDESFEGGLDRWTQSEATKEGADAEIAKYDGPWTLDTDEVDGEKNHGLLMPDANKHYAITSVLPTPITFTDKPLVVQYEVMYKEGVGCGGSYLKLLSAPEEGTIDPKAVEGQTPYTIMFGPDKCGMDSKLHFIFRHKSPKTGEFREVHARKIAEAQELLFTQTKKWNLVKLVIKPDNTFQVMVNNKPVLSGRLGSEDEFDPALSPPKKIDDPDDSKPEDWVDDEKMDDPADIKPPDFDQPKEVNDPDAIKPEEWDEEMDGDWEAPMIANPDYKGKWEAKRIDNPDYKGVWSPKQLDNPDYFEDQDPFATMTSIAAVTYELWVSEKAGYVFDNVIITDNEKEADAKAAEWEARRAEQDKIDPEESSTLDYFLEQFKNPWVIIATMIAIFVPLYLCLCAAGEEESTQETAEPAQEASEEKPASEVAAEADEVADDNGEEDATASPDEAGEGEGEIGGEEKEKATPRRSARNRKSTE